MCHYSVATGGKKAPTRLRSRNIKMTKIRSLLTRSSKLSSFFPKGAAQWCSWVSYCLINSFDGDGIRRNRNFTICGKYFILESPSVPSNSYFNSKWILPYL